MLSFFEALEPSRPIVGFEAGSRTIYSSASFPGEIDRTLCQGDHDFVESI